MRIAELQERAIQDSRWWFPGVHETQQSAVVHFALGLAGEVGELVNLIKKANRSPKWTEAIDMTDVAHEAADCAIYLMDLCAEMGIDLAEAIEAKRLILIDRWGKPHPNG